MHLIRAVEERESKRSVTQAQNHLTPSLLINQLPTAERNPNGSKSHGRNLKTRGLKKKGERERASQHAAIGKGGEGKENLPRRKRKRKEKKTRSGTMSGKAQPSRANKTMTWRLMSDDRHYRFTATVDLSSILHPPQNPISLSEKAQTEQNEETAGKAQKDGHRGKKLKKAETEGRVRRCRPT